MYNLHLSPEQIEIRDTVRDFARGEIKPLASSPQRMEALDRSPLEAVLTQAAELGLRTLALPEEMGGAGADTLTCAIVAEELAVGDADTASILAETSLLARVLFAELMSSAQRDVWLPALATDSLGQLAWARSLADAELGINYHRPVDTARMTVTAVRAGNHYVLNGVARGVANAPVAVLIAVSAAADTKGQLSSKAITLLVPRGAVGMTIKPLSAGRFLGSCGDIIFDNCRVPADHLLDKAGGKLPQVLARIDAAPLRQAVNLGIGRAAYEAAVDYAKLRVQGGRPIIEHQAIAQKLAESAVRIVTARQAIWAAAWACDHPHAVADGSLTTLPLAAIARIHTAEAMYSTAKDCAECFGAMSVMRDMPLHKYVEDARRCLHADGGMTDAKLALAEAIAEFRRD